MTKNPTPRQQHIEEISPEDVHCKKDWFTLSCYLISSLKKNTFFDEKKSQTGRGLSALHFQDNHLSKSAPFTETNTYCLENVTVDTAKERRFF